MIGDEQEELKDGLNELPARSTKETKCSGNSAHAERARIARQRLPAHHEVAALLLEKLRPLLNTATPVVKNFTLSFSRPGKNNDLTELAAAIPALAKTLETTSPATVQSLKESIPITAFWVPTPRSRGHAAKLRPGGGLL